MCAHGILGQESINALVGTSINTPSMSWSRLHQHPKLYLACTQSTLNWQSVYTWLTLKWKDILAKMENNLECYQYLSWNNFPKMKIILANGRLIDDLFLPDILHTPTGKRVSANFQHWCNCVVPGNIDTHLMVAQTLRCCKESM